MPQLFWIAALGGYLLGFGVASKLVPQLLSKPFSPYLLSMASLAAAGILVMMGRAMFRRVRQNRNLVHIKEKRAKLGKRPLVEQAMELSPAQALATLPPVKRNYCPVFSLPQRHREMSKLELDYAAGDANEAEIFLEEVQRQLDRHTELGAKLLIDVPFSLAGRLKRLGAAIEADPFDDTVMHLAFSEDPGKLPTLTKGAARRLRIGRHVSADEVRLDYSNLRGLDFVILDKAPFAPQGDQLIDQDLGDGLATLEDAGVEIIVGNISSQAALLDVLDYPVHYGFGAHMDNWQSARPRMTKAGFVEDDVTSAPLLSGA